MVKYVPVSGSEHDEHNLSAQLLFEALHHSSRIKFIRTFSLNYLIKRLEALKYELELNEGHVKFTRKVRPLDRSL